jgi:hypothetical protein
MLTSNYVPRDGRRRGVGIVLHGVPMLVFALFGILFRRRVASAVS